MRYFIRKTAVLFLLILSCIFLSACGGLKPVKDAQIKKDLSEGNYLQNSGMGGLSIDKIEIEKRQTDQKEKTDEIWCTISLGSEVYDQQDHLKLDYTNYTKGDWILDNYEVLSSDVTLKQGPTADEEETVRTAIMEERYWWPNCTVTVNCDTVDLDAATAVYTGSATCETSLARLTETFTVQLYFSAEKQWLIMDHPKSTGKDSEVLMDMSGHYKTKIFEYDLVNNGNEFQITNATYYDYNYGSTYDMIDFSGTFSVEIPHDKVLLEVDVEHAEYIWSYKTERINFRQYYDENKNVAVSWNDL